MYVGQTGRCDNVRVREQSLSLRSSPSGLLALSCEKCTCSPLFDDINVLARHRSKSARKINDAFFIVAMTRACVLSAPSIALASDEVHFIRKSGKYV